MMVLSAEVLSLKECSVCKGNRIVAEGFLKYTPGLQDAGCQNTGCSLGFAGGDGSVCLSPSQIMAGATRTGVVHSNNTEGTVCFACPRGVHARTTG